MNTEKQMVRIFEQRCLKLVHACRMKRWKEVVIISADITSAALRNVQGEKEAEQLNIFEHGK